MALGKRKSGGEFLPVLKYDATIGKFYLQDRVYANGGWETQQTNVETDKFRAVLDLKNLQRGWIRFPKGAAPEMKMVPAGSDPGEPPSDAHREGIRLIAKMDASLDGSVRELLSTAISLWGAVDDLHDKYLAGVEKHPGCLPTVDVVEVIEKKTASGASYVPVFKIAGWVPRPPELPGAGTPIAEKKPTRPAVKDDMSDSIPF